MISDHLFESSIATNNRRIGIIKISKLLNIDIELPEIQRIVDNDNVSEIINYQINYFKKNKHFNFLGVLNIHHCKDRQTYYLIDGQHRYNAIKGLFNMGHCDFNVTVEIVDVESINELKDNYKMINKNTQLPEFSEEIDKSIPEKVAIHFKGKYTNMWSKNSRPRRPHLYFTFFQEALGILTEKLKINDAKELIEIVEDYNNYLSNWNLNNFPDNKSLNNNIYCK